MLPRPVRPHSLNRKVILSVRTQVNDRKPVYMKLNNKNHKPFGSRILTLKKKREQDPKPLSFNIEYLLIQKNLLCLDPKKSNHKTIS